MKRDCQLEYASDHPLMYDKKSRERRAMRLVKTLEDHLGKGELKKMNLLDVGSSSGIIDNYLSQHFKSVTGIDIDKGAVASAQKKYKRKNLKYMHGDAMKLCFKNESFDVVICLQVYEHVPDDTKLVKEIYRVLKPTRVCYMALGNKLWPIEPHYKLPFLSWLPYKWADWYLRILKKNDHYHERFRTYWGLKELTKRFKRIEYTQKILRDSKKFGYDDILKNGSWQANVAYFLSPLSKYFSPTFFWILEKK